MRRTKLLVTTLLLLVPTLAFAQSTKDEIEVIETALQYQSHGPLPYVRYWVVAARTEPLKLADAPPSAVSEDYIRRNAHSISTEGITLPERFVVADLSGFSRPGSFDWAAFDQKYTADETWTARVARPGFSDASHALVRVDGGNGRRLGVSVATLLLSKRSGVWQVVRCVYVSAKYSALGDAAPN